MSKPGGVWWRPRREHAWWLLVLAALLAVGAVLPVEWLGPRWLRLSLAIACGLGSAFLLWLTNAAKRRDAQADVLGKSTRTAGLGSDKLPMVGDLSLDDFGVHKPLNELPYMHRSYEDDLHAALEAGEPVLVLGKSLAGKTRLAAEVLRQNFPDRNILIPDAPTGLADLLDSGGRPRRVVIWLDDLDRYIDDPKNFKRRWLTQLLDDGNLLVATMREKAYERYLPIGDVLSPDQLKVLGQFSRIRILDSDAERQQLAANIREPRMRDAVRRWGLGAYIGGGPVAAEAFYSARNNHPRAYALIQAAVDWRRTGIGDVIPSTTAEQLIPAYLTPRQIKEDRESLAAAVEWATSWETGRDAFRLLTPEGDGWRAFDYLGEIVSMRKEAIPRRTRTAAAGVDSSAALNAAGETALKEGRIDVAERMFRRSAALDDPLGLVYLGVSLEYRGQAAKAEELYRRAVDHDFPPGMTCLGTLLERLGQTAEAEQLYQRAADRDDPRGMTKLGVLLAKRGQILEAETLLRHAANLSWPVGMTNLGILLARRKEYTAAEQLFRRAADLGWPGGWQALGELFVERGRKEEAEVYFRRATKEGHWNLIMQPISEVQA